MYLSIRFTAKFSGKVAGAALSALLTAGIAMAPALAAHKLVKIKLSDNGDFIVPLLADSLGYFKQEGLQMVRSRVADVAPEDYLMQEALISGKIDASYHWFQHTIYGARHNVPIVAVILLNDAPGAKVMVADRVKDQIKSAADFKGRNIAEGAGYATKSMLTNYLAVKAGLPPHSYTPVFKEVEGRQDAVTQGLKEGRVDVVTFLEPMSAAISKTNMVTTLYDLTTKESTIKAFGAPYAAQSILVAPKYIEMHPDTVQRLVNTFVRTMRWVNSHSAEQIAEKLPASYFEKKDRQAELEYIRNTLPTYAKGNYSISPASAQLVLDTILATDFDSSHEGVWRATTEKPGEVDLAHLYTNRFVEKAMRAIK